MDTDDNVSMVDYVPLDAINESGKTAVSSKTGISSSVSSSSFSKDISLFPFLDIFLKIVPSVVIKNRCLRILLICISIIALLFLPSWQIYQGLRYDDTETDTDVNQLFVFTMYFFPFCAAFARLYFFARHFRANNIIWHYHSIPLRNNRLSTVSMDSDFNNLPYLLRQSAKIKKKIRKQFRIGFIINFILYSLLFISFIWTGVTFYSSSATSKKEKQQIQYEQIIWFSIQYFFGLLPDFGLICVARLYFTECYLYILNFTDSISVITSFGAKTISLLDDMIEFDLIEKYQKMYKTINSYIHQFNYFIFFWVIMIAFVYWFLITLCFFTDWTDYNLISSSNFIIPLYVQFGVFAIQAFVAAIFMLWPAFKMTELFQQLQEKINNQISVLLDGGDRIYLHDEDKLLNDITKSNNYGNINVTDLHKNITIYSKQKACLEILYRLKSILIEYPCSYSLLGLTLDRYSIRDFIVAILIGKIVSFLWNGISDNY